MTYIEFVLAEPDQAVQYKKETQQINEMSNIEIHRISNLRISLSIFPSINTLDRCLNQQHNN